jgi:hypothetical protein
MNRFSPYQKHYPHYNTAGKEKEPTKKAAYTAFLCQAAIEEYDSPAVRLIIREIIINETG